MALPKLLRMLFDNNGAGDKLRKSILPVSPVEYETQTLTTAQKTQARTNIDAVSESELRTALEELIVEYGGTVPTD